jgi:hypothetical protein
MRFLKKNECFGLMSGLSVCLFFFIVTVYLPENNDDEDN